MRLRSLRPRFDLIRPQQKLGVRLLYAPSEDCQWAPTPPPRSRHSAAVSPAWHSSLQL